MVKLTGRYLSIILLLLSFTAAAATANNSHDERTVKASPVPGIVFTNQDDEKIQLQPLLNDEIPVTRDHVVATCTIICPVFSAGFINPPNKFVSGSNKAWLMTIIIDPGHDTPYSVVSRSILKPYQARREEGT